MLLAVDVGNTQTVIGIYDGKDLRFNWRVATNKQHTADELRVKLTSLLAADQIDKEELKGLALASVVPNLTVAWRGVAQALCGKDAVVCSADTAKALFAADYPNPAEIGSDRVADAVAAKEVYGAPVVVVDFGTATNIEIINSKGAFVGGIIAPGVETSAQALFSRATKLGAIDLTAPQQVIGRNTEKAMQAGIVLGEVDRVDGLVQRIFEQLGYSTTVVATGGLARRIAPLSKTITHTDQDLTLEGLRLIYCAQK